MTDPLKSSRLLYRAVELPQDAEFYYSMKQDVLATANSFFGILRPASHEDVETQLKSAREKNLLFVVICLLPPSTAMARHTDTEKTEAESKEKPTPIGFLALSGAYGGLPANAHHRGAMIGIELHQDYRGNGYGTEAIEWVLKWGFQIAGMHRIAIGTVSYNSGAVKLYDRMGFVRESTGREAIWYNGAWHDTIGWSLLEHEWKERQAKKVAHNSL